MHKILFSSLVMLVMACGKKEDKTPAPAPGKQGPQIRVMTFNIYGARASSGTPADLQVIAKIINDAKPDLVALQEVDVNTQRTGTTVNQAKELAALTGMDWHFAKAMELQGGAYGDAVLSKLAVVSAKSYALPVDPGVGGETRSVAMIKVKKEDREFYFASTHFDHLQQEDSRLLQATEFKKIVQSLDLPLVAAGDLNATPDSRTIGILKSVINLGCPQQCPLTFPSSQPNRTIDYIMTAPTNTFSVSSYTALTGWHEEKKVYASDHRPVIAVMKVY
ncbi:endonuclease/exonuclease/phosphatase family protein [Chitinophaga rhizosphaerae]|uniref:endonuclease/exonuclease/phosphatase family protein n=1 Tax=Chitinophaga rhizosphaerae TaxID=1864947 RepID=UPI000F8135B4|nr:endonuclease/exonuclease/phosphatase family protein [Chitinophaga rhizosphaerae]